MDARTPRCTIERGGAPPRDAGRTHGASRAWRVLATAFTFGASGVASVLRSVAVLPALGILSGARERRSLIIFPEGTRSPARRLAPFLRGAAHIALRAGRDPMPVLIRCEPPTLQHGRRCWNVPERRFDPDLHAGEPLRPKDAVGDSRSRSEAARALTRSIRDHFSRYLPCRLAKPCTMS